MQANTDSRRKRPPLFGHSLVLRILLCLAIGALGLAGQSAMASDHFPQTDCHAMATQFDAAVPAVAGGIDLNAGLGHGSHSQICPALGCLSVCFSEVGSPPTSMQITTGATASFDRANWPGRAIPPEYRPPIV